MGEYLGQAQADLRQVGGDRRQLLATVLKRHVDQAAGIDHVIRGIEDAARLHLVGDIGAGELVVGRAGHRRATQLVHRLGVEHTTQAAGREDVARCGEEGIGSHRLGAQLLDGQLHTAAVQVADQQLGTRCMELFGQGVAHVAETLHGDAQAF
ncbi:hypothetical protein D3C85_1481510 [compost metagenome]